MGVTRGSLISTGFLLPGSRPFLAGIIIRQLLSTFRLFSSIIIIELKAQTKPDFQMKED
jgi:hypothetical protein